MRHIPPAAELWNADVFSMAIRPDSCCEQLVVCSGSGTEFVIENDSEKTKQNGA